MADSLLYQLSHMLATPVWEQGGSRNWTLSAKQEEVSWCVVCLPFLRISVLTRSMQGHRRTQASRLVLAKLSASHHRCSARSRRARSPGRASACCRLSVFAKSSRSTSSPRSTPVPALRTRPAHSPLLILLPILSPERCDPAAAPAFLPPFAALFRQRTLAREPATSAPLP